jgi:photosystem II stability/assembly factor-like uncharacterized protein
MNRRDTMFRAQFATILPLVTLLALGASMATCVSAQGSWEYLGPGVGYYTESLCVTDQALYVGMAEQSGPGLGLYRYRFADGQWESFALPGQRVTAVSVAGAGDERIVAAHFDSTDVTCGVLRSTDGGQTWTETVSPCWDKLMRIRRAPSESTHLYIVNGLRSTDDGASWQTYDCDDCANNNFDAAYDPQNADVLYMTGESFGVAWNIYKSTDGGAYFRRVDFASFCYGIAVDVADPNRVLATRGLDTRSSNDAGVTWTTRSCSPLNGKMVAVASWAPGCFFLLGRTGGQFDVARTSDLGVTWDPVAPGLPSAPSGSDWGIRMYIESHPTQPEVYVALEGSGVWRFAYDPATAPDVPDRPHSLRLAAFPNPATDGFRVDLRLPQATLASLRLLDVRGRVVDTLFEGLMPEGAGEVRWVRPAGGSVPAGVYYLRLEAEEAHVQRAITLVR